MFPLNIVAVSRHFVCVVSGKTFILLPSLNIYHHDNLTCWQTFWHVTSLQMLLSCGREWFIVMKELKHMLTVSQLWKVTDVCPVWSVCGTYPYQFSVSPAQYQVQDGCWVQPQVAWVHSVQLQSVMFRLKMQLFTSVIQQQSSVAQFK